MTLEQFKIEIKKLGLNLTPQIEEKLEKFYQILIKTNETMNLTRITTKEDVYLKHFYDSITLSKIYNFNNCETLCDIGSGAGFPGIIIKIFYPNLKITLIDALQKRVNYLNNLIEQLELKDIKAYHIRAEDLKKEKKTFDVVTARAVASLPKLLIWAMPLVKKDGVFLAMKGKINEEIKEAQPIINQKKYKITNQINFNLPYENSTRTIIKIER